MIEQYITVETINLLQLMGSMILGFWIKDLAVNFVSGFSFWLNKAFNAGDEVYLDKQKAIIIKIGFRQTIFQMEDDRGTTWRYVANSRINVLKLEKLIRKEE